MGKKLIQFDWVLKKLLRHKASFDILEGFLLELLRFDVTIESILESEGNQQDEYDKLMLVEMQNDPQIDFFHRMLFGAPDGMLSEVSSEAMISE